MADFGFSHEYIILDACCIMNLYASRKMGEILETIPKSVAIAAYIHKEEALWIYGGPDDNVTQEKERIDLQPLIEKKLLTVVSPETEAEQNTFVAFATILGDDGESITGAIALHRNWAIATDDKKATRFFQREAPHLQIISTLELLKFWVDTVKPAPEIVSATLQVVQQRANYKPGDKHPLYEWWQSRLSGYKKL